MTTALTAWTKATGDLDAVGGIKFTPASESGTYTKEVWVYVAPGAAASLHIRANADTASAASSEFDLVLEAGQGALVGQLLGREIGSLALISTAKLTYGTDFVVKS